MYLLERLYYTYSHWRYYMNTTNIKFKNGKLTITTNGVERVIHSVDSFEMEMMCKSEMISDVTCKYDFDTYMPEKGYGYVVIDKAENKEKVKEIIKEHVGEFEFDYLPDGFIQADDEPTHEKYYGKFEITDLPGLYDKIHNAGVGIVSAKFHANIDM